MIYAMHQIMVACLVRNAPSSAWHRRLLRRLCDEQLLLASSTTDGQGGGDLRKSDCAVDQQGTGFTLAKNATVMRRPTPSWRPRAARPMPRRPIRSWSRS
jgi:acyl-CoA dehydrogenase